MSGLRWLRKLIDGPPLDQDALTRELAEAAYPPGPIISMEAHLAALPPPPPAFEPEWLGDTAWRDSREDSEAHA